MNLVDVTKTDGAVVLCLNDPGRRNLLSTEMSRALRQAVEEANAEQDAHLIIIRANGTAFCAGADLEDLKAAARGDTSAVQDVYDAFLAVANSVLPTIAVVEGAAVGAGMNLALACDVRLVTESARFDTRFLQIGLHPGGGHTWMLHRAVGWENATRLLLLGDIVDGRKAVEIGLASQCVPNERLNDELHSLIKNAIRAPRDLLVRTKESLRHSVFATHEVSYRRETVQQMWSLGQPAFTALVEKLQNKLSKKVD